MDDVLSRDEFVATLAKRLTPAALESLTARDHAELFRRTFGADELSGALRTTLQLSLLRRTLDHARTSTAHYATAEYRELKVQVHPAPSHGASLDGWPIIRRGDLRRDPTRFIAHDVRFASVCHTSGSTGQPLDIYKSFEELAFGRAYQSAMLAPYSRALDSIPLILSFPTAYHGVAVAVPSAGKVFVSGVTDDTLIADAAALLQRRHHIAGHDERITMLSGMLFQVLFFTSYLIEQGLDPRDLGMKSIVVFGGYATTSDRKFLADAWGAVVHDRFSLTESAGGANRCHQCDHFHFDPHVLAEVLDVDTGQAMDEGVGILVLTQLYPFVQMQPLIRYETGDIVRRVRGDCNHSFTFDFLGKRENCIQRQLMSRSCWLLFSVDLFELVNALPDVGRVDWFRNVTRARDTTVGSKPLQRVKAAELADGRLQIEIELELRYAPHFFPNRTEELRAHIVSGLRRAKTAMAACLDDGSVTLDVRFRGPGELSGESFIKV